MNFLKILLLCTSILLKNINFIIIIFIFYLFLEERVRAARVHPVWSAVPEQVFHKKRLRNGSI